MRTGSSEGGWASVYALVFFVIVQGIALTTCMIITHDVKSGNTFRALLAARHAGEGSGAGPASRTVLLDAPEGWDHACFRTEVTERRWGDETRYSWIARIREQPYRMYPDQVLDAWRPHVILLVDDSIGMLHASGGFYHDDRIYIKRSGGEIVPDRDRDDVAGDLATPAGVTFRGLYGNTVYPAEDSYHFGGVTQCWTLAHETLYGLVDDLDLCPMAVATVSRGVIQPFTTDRKTLLSALRGIRPGGHVAALSERLLSIVEEFPESCITARHIIVATSGIAVHDGNIPARFQDFDHDADPCDRYIEGAGSRCLDDVAAYAFSRGVRVHTVGPGSGFLRDTALKGGGDFMPTLHSFSLPDGFLSQAPCMDRESLLLLTNVALALGPPWMETSGTAYKRVMANGLPHLGGVPPFPVRGTASSLFHESQLLVCTTTRDHLLLIDLPSGSCRWMVQGAGGRVTKREGLIIAGPGLDGDILVMNCDPEILWSCRGRVFSASRGSVYVSDGTGVTSYSLPIGIQEAHAGLDSGVCLLEHDPCTGNVLAGTQSGTVTVLDQHLDLQGSFWPGLNGSLSTLRSFRIHKDYHLVAATASEVACLGPGGVLWRADIAGGVCTNVLVMDSRVYITAWEPGACGGIDSGRSSLTVLSASDGSRISVTSLFGAKAFGPVVDLEAGALVFAGSSREVARVDISGLNGVTPVDLGSMMASN